MEERRIDPDDNQLYTRAEIRRKYRDFSPEDIAEYWANDCRPCPGSWGGSYGAHAGFPSSGSASFPVSMVGGYPAPDLHERRIDPEDGKDYSFWEFREKVRATFEDSEVLAYWFEDMRIELPEGTKVFVSGLSKETTADVLNDVFSLCGEVAFIQVILNQETDEPKGFAKAPPAPRQVQFSSIASAERAVRELTGVSVDGQAISVRPLLDKGKCLKIFVSGLPGECTEEEFEAHFDSCGEIVFSQLFYDRHTLEPNGQGKVEFVFPESAAKAMKWFNGCQLGGRRIEIQEWRESATGRRIPGPLAFVSRLHPSTTAKSLRKLAEATGRTIVDALVYFDRETSESRKMGKLELTDDESLQAIIKELDGAMLDGTSISVREFDPTAGVSGRRTMGPAVFVANFGYEVTMERLAEYFAGCGQVISCTVFCDKETGKPKGAGRVEFATEDAAARALELAGSVLDGRTVHVREFGRTPEAAAAASAAAPRFAPERFGAPERFKVFVAGLTSETTAQDLKEHFACCGVVVDAHVFTDKSTGASRCFAKVHMGTDEAQQKAIDEMNGSELNGKQIIVREYGVNAPSNSGQPDGTSVFVSGLNWFTSAETLRAFFAEAGEVKDAVIYCDASTGRSKGIARVSFASAAGARSAISLWNGAELQGHSIQVREFAAGGSSGAGAQRASEERPTRAGPAPSKAQDFQPQGVASRGRGRGRGRGGKADDGRGADGDGRGAAGGGGDGKGKRGRGRGSARGAGKAWGGCDDYGATGAGGFQGPAGDSLGCRGDFGTEEVFGEGELHFGRALEQITEEEVEDLRSERSTSGIGPRCVVTRVGRWRGWSQRPQGEAAAGAPEDSGLAATSAGDAATASVVSDGDEEERGAGCDAARATSAPSAVDAELRAHDDDEVGEFVEDEGEAAADGGSEEQSRPPEGSEERSEAAERRVDPDDDRPYTFAELLLKYDGLCDEDEVQEYWDLDCQPLGPRAGLEAAAAPPPDAGAQAPASASQAHPPAAAASASDAAAHAQAGEPAPAAAEAVAAEEVQEVVPDGRPAAPSPPLRMSLKEWVEAIDQQWLRHTSQPPGEHAGVQPLLQVLEEHFDDLNQILQLYAKRGPDDQNILADDFFEDVGIKKIGHKRMFKEWIRRNT